MAGTPTGLVLALLDEFASDMREPRTINQIALSSGKAYANVHAAATALIAENVLVKETVGHSHRCRLNLANDTTLLYLSLLQVRKRDALLHAQPELFALLNTIDAIGPQHSILLVWKREQDFLIVTTAPATSRIIDGFPAQHTVLPLAEFLGNGELFSTIGKHTLLFGHALYASMLAQCKYRMEVQR